MNAKSKATKRRIAILGGGMAALSAAYELTKTQGLRDENEVTVYQLGWRLGGKAASGRDAQGRNLEHGLHVWFGMYENTFKMIQEIYAARDPTKTWALPTWRSAVKPQNFTPIGVKSESGEWSYWPLTWATNHWVPGDGTPLLNLPRALETILDWITLGLPRDHEPTPAAALVAAGPLPRNLQITLTPSGALYEAKAHLRDIGDPSLKSAHDSFERAIELISWARDAHTATAGTTVAPSFASSIGSQLLDIFLAVMKGIFEDLILQDAPLVSIDDKELSDWLCYHGADPTIVATSSVVRAAYDTIFQYAGGDSSKRSLAAGSGLGTLIRIAAMYKESVMWQVQAGMGEVIVGPLYEHLLDAGVRFKFFHKVTSIEPDTADPSDNPEVKTIRIDLQAKTLAGDYIPVTHKHGFILWPSDPDWQQLEGGAAMQAANVNFESNWCNWPRADSVVLERGVDFDVVVLAIALGALKPLNAEDPSICAPLMAKNPGFANWINSIDLVPSLGVQLWSDLTTAELGWTQATPATVSGPEYLDIWADMSQILPFEGWPAPQPKSLHYLTGTFATTLYQRPKSATSTPAEAAAELRRQTVDWLNSWSAVMWPRARTAGGFNWSVLTAPAGSTGEARLDAQFLRANIDPTECTTLSAPGTTRFRLHADESGFRNLFLAGEGTAMGLTTSFEGAIMSGAAASRAICGQPVTIMGYDFLELPPSRQVRS